MGAVGPGNGHTGIPLSHTAKANPISEYGKSKLLSEEFIRSMPNFPWIILRPTGVYGPRERDYLVILKMIKAGFDVSVGLKQQRLNFIYIKDLARLCIEALESSFTQKTWFVADGDVYSSKAFSSLIQEVLQQKRILSIRIPLSIVKSFSIASGVFGRLTGKPALLNPDKYKVLKQRNWTCEIYELKHDLSFKPEYNLRRGMEETVDWYKKNGWL
jgi:UDP-glucose 4-epimerase